MGEEWKYLQKFCILFFYCWSYCFLNQSRIIYGKFSNKNNMFFLPPNLSIKFKLLLKKKILTIKSQHPKMLALILAIDINMGRPSSWGEISWTSCRPTQSGLFPSLTTGRLRTRVEHFGWVLKKIWKGFKFFLEIQYCLVFKSCSTS